MFNLLGSSTRVHTTATGPNNSSANGNHNITGLISTDHMTEADLNAIPGELARRNRVSRLAAAMRHLHLEAMREIDMRDVDETRQQRGDDNNNSNTNNSGDDTWTNDLGLMTSTPKPLRFHATGWQRKTERRPASQGNKQQGMPSSSSIALGKTRVVVETGGDQQEQQHHSRASNQRSSSRPNSSNNNHSSSTAVISPPRKAASPAIGSPVTALRSRPPPQQQQHYQQQQQLLSPSSVLSLSPAPRSSVEHHPLQLASSSAPRWSDRNRQRHIKEEMEQKALAKAQRAYDKEMHRQQKRMLRRRANNNSSSGGKQEMKNNSDSSGSDSSSTGSGEDDEDESNKNQEESRKKKKRKSARNKDDDALSRSNLSGGFAGATEAEKLRNAAISLRAINLQLKTQFEKRYRSKLADDDEDTVDGVDAGRTRQPPSLGSIDDLQGAAKAGLALDERSRELGEMSRKWRQAALDAELLTGEVLRANATIERYKNYIESLQNDGETMREELASVKKQLETAKFGSFHQSASSRFGSWRQNTEAGGEGGGATDAVDRERLKRHHRHHEQQLSSGTPSLQGGEESPQEINLGAEVILICDDNHQHPRQKQKQQLGDALAEAQEDKGVRSDLAPSFVL